MSREGSIPASLRTLGVVCPAATVLIAAPITIGALGMPPDSSKGLIISPTVLALVAAPGYLRAVLPWASIPSLSPLQRAWVRLSFAVGLVASGVGAAIGAVFIIPSLAALATAVVIVKVWRRLET